MNKIFSIDFKFKDRLCFAIIRTSTKNETTRYQVRIMNSRLETLLCGYNTFEEINGELLNGFPATGRKELQLRGIIYESLNSYLKNERRQTGTHGIMLPAFRRPILLLANN